MRLRSAIFFCSAIAAVGLNGSADAAACVWKVTSPTGTTLYLGGSWHALRSSDYPLPGAYNQAFDASERLAFEVSPDDLKHSGGAAAKAGEYPKGDSLKNHVDPRTYDYLKRFFGLLHVPESKFSRYKPWYISLMLEAPSLHGLSEELGVESFYEKRARSRNKPITGLETLHEHLDVFAGLSDRGSEALLLITFIPTEKSSPGFSQMMNAWRHGNAEVLTATTRNGFRDFPAMADRLLTARNRNWIPKLQTYLNSGHTYFVIAGAAHMGGDDGVVALLRGRGYRVEQL